jgi:pimeloyl-ACP methyl ester carboxylesterase
MARDREGPGGHPPPGRLVDIGGHRLHLWCTGDGAPVVILDTGLGSTTAAWGFVQPDVARFTRVCSYDRAGLGYSDAGPTPRTARRMASELAALLDRGGIGGPVVLVAASSGGFNVRVLASDHPERAAALVLVDASHEDQPHDIPRLATFVPLLARVGVLRLLGISFDLRGDTLAPSTRRFARATRFRAAGYGAAAGEIMHIRESATEVRNSRRTLSIPVVVVTGARGADVAWHGLQRDLVTLSERGCQIIARDAGHVVAIDQRKSSWPRSEASWRSCEAAAMCHCAARRLRELEDIRSGRVQDGRRRAVAPLRLATTVLGQIAAGRRGGVDARLAGCHPLVGEPQATSQSLSALARPRHRPVSTVRQTDPPWEPGHAIGSSPRHAPRDHSRQ